MLTSTTTKIKTATTSATAVDKEDCGKIDNTTPQADKNDHKEAQDVDVDKQVDDDDDECSVLDPSEIYCPDPVNNDVIHIGNRPTYITTTNNNTIKSTKKMVSIPKDTMKRYTNSKEASALESCPDTDVIYISDSSTKQDQNVEQIRKNNANMRKRNRMREKRGCSKYKQNKRKE